MDKHFETERVSNKRKIMYYNFIAELAKTEMFFDFYGSISIKIREILFYL